MSCVVFVIRTARLYSESMIVAISFRKGMQIFQKNTDDFFFQFPLFSLTVVHVSKVFKGYILSLHQTWPEKQKVFFVVHVS